MCIETPRICQTTLDWSYLPFLKVCISNILHMKLTILWSIFLLSVSPLMAQKTVTTDEQAWFAVFNQTRLSKK